MIKIEELKAINAEIVEEALRELGINKTEQDKLDRIRRLCESTIAKNEALKQNVKDRPDHQRIWQELDARNQPLLRILGIVREDSKS